MVDPILDLVTKGSLGVADRNFCFQRFLLGIAQRLGFFIIREHAGLNYQVVNPLRKCGRSVAGTLLEQTVTLKKANGQRCRLRRIVVRWTKRPRMATGN